MGGILSDKVCTELLWDTELILARAEHACRINEIMASHTRSLGPGPHSSYHVDVTDTSYHNQRSQPHSSSRQSQRLLESVLTVAARTLQTANFALL